MPFRRPYFELEIRKRKIRLKLPWTEASGRSKNRNSSGGGIARLQRRQGGDVIPAEAEATPCNSDQDHRNHQEEEEVQPQQLHQHHHYHPENEDQDQELPSPSPLPELRSEEEVHIQVVQSDVIEPLLPPPSSPPLTLFLPLDHYQHQHQYHYQRPLSSTSFSTSPIEHELPALLSSSPTSPINAATLTTSLPSLSTPPSPVSSFDTFILKDPSLVMTPAPLNPEPAAPEEREAHHLPPKSYADAAEEGLDIQHKSSETPHSPDASETPNTPTHTSEITSDQEEKHQGSPALNAEPSVPEEREAQNLLPKSYADAADGFDGVKEHRQNHINNIQTNGRITIPSTDETVQYEGEGQDNSPKSPTRGHKRRASQKSNGSIGRKHGEQFGSEVYEKYHTGDGRSLTSAKPPSEYENEKDARQDNRQLTTGREAGAGWHTSKIRWAPFNVPVKRRLQTLAVLMHTLSIAGLVGIFFFLCSIPLLWPILVPYLIYALMSNAGTSGQLYFRNERFRRLPVWSLFASYYPMRLHRIQKLEPTRKYIFGYHPHGIISHGAFAAFATEALGFSQLFPGITNTLLTLDSNFRLPLYREYALRMGLASVSRESIQNILSRGGTNGEGMGRAVTIVIGGAREALEARPGYMRLVIQRRKGFAKMAIRTGADLVPVLAFGENDIYDQFDVASRPYVKKLQILVKKVVGFTTPLFHARGIFNYDVGLMPYRKPINIVVGKPIRVKQESHPDKTTVDSVHSEYVAELQRLYDEWKDTFAKERKEDMKFIE